MEGSNELNSGPDEEGLNLNAPSSLANSRSASSWVFQDFSSAAALSSGVFSNS